MKSKARSDMFNTIIRTAIIYAVIIFAMRLMGKKQAAQLQPYELVVTLIISDVVSTPMDSPAVPLNSGLVPALTLMLLYYLFSVISLKFRGFRTFISGTPSIMILRGKLNEEEIRKVKYNLSDLMEQLRISGYTNIADIHYAVLETNGQLSVMPYSNAAPVTPDQLNLEVEEDDMSVAVVLDGEIQIDGLAQLGITNKSIEKLIHTIGARRAKEVFLMTLSSAGEVFVQKKGGETKTLRLARRELK